MTLFHSFYMPQKFCFSLMDSTVTCNLLVPHTQYLSVLVTDVTQYWPLGQCHYMILLLTESFWQFVVFDHVRCILRVIMSTIWITRFLRDASLLFVHSCLSAEYLIYRIKHRSTNHFFFNSKLYNQSSNCTCILYSSGMYQLAWEMFYSSGCYGTAVMFGKWRLHNFAWICHCSCETIHSYWFRITIFMKI